MTLDHNHIPILAPSAPLFLDPWEEDAITVTINDTIDDETLDARADEFYFSGLGCDEVE